MDVPPDGRSDAAGDSSSGGDPGTDAEVHAFLIGDIRGWTSFTQEHGDEHAARLAARFARIVDEMAERFRGRVVELRGDEALVVFGSPRSAIRAAVALQDRFVEESIADPSLPLTVGVGLDAGEAVPVEGGYRGGALNMAGRLQARANAGEVLATREIVHLARRIDGVSFTERGSLTLKGLEEPVPVIEVASERRDAASAMAAFVRPASPSAAPRRRWKAVALAGALALVAGLIAIPALQNADVRSEIAPNSVGIIEPASGEVVATLGLRARPGSIAASTRAVWMTYPDDGTVVRIDPSTRAVVDSIPVGGNPTDIAVTSDAVWVVESAGPTVSRISPDTGEIVDTIEVGNGPAAIAVGEGAVWVANRFDGTISRIDPKRVGAVTEIPVGLDPRGIVVGFGDVWVSLAGSNQVVRVDPTSHEVSAPIGVGNAPLALAVGAGGVWVANSLADTVSEIDPESDTVVDTIEVGDGPTGLEVIDEAVWVANEAEGTLSHIVSGETPARFLMIKSVPLALAGVGRELWVTVKGTATSHRGGTLRLVGNYSPGSLDPSTAYDSAAWMVLHLMGDGLVAFEPVGGIGGTLVPDLAMSIPAPTEEGRRYTFEIRPGIRYSNGEVVSAIDFRRAIERAFLLQPDSHALYQGLVGGERCHEAPERCDLRRGVEIDDPDGTTITFNLEAPDPEFLYKLTIPFAYPIPPSVPDEARTNLGAPGTGPYVLDSPMTEAGLTLVRNPHFETWSPAAQPDGYVDRIEWTFGMPTRTQVEAVAAGEADLTFDGARSPRLDELFVRFPGRIHSTPRAQTLFVVLDTRSPPFDDPEVRRAMNLAIDRGEIVEIFGGEGSMRPTCQQLPPNFPGSEPYCPYTAKPGAGGQSTWSAPGLTFEEARAVVRRAGVAGMRVVLEYPPSYWPQGAAFGAYMVDLLNGIGFRGGVDALPLDAFYDPGNEFQMALAAWTADYPAASNLIDNFFSCDATLTPRSGFCDPSIDAMIQRANSAQVADPAGSGALWTEVDRAIVDQAPYIWLTNPNTVSFVSERVGNYQFDPQWGVLLNQLWVR